MVLMQWLLSSLFLDSDIWMREFTVTFTWASELGTSIAIRLSAVVAQEEAAKNYSGVDPWILVREGVKFEGWMPKAGEGGGNVICMSSSSSTFWNLKCSHMNSEAVGWNYAITGEISPWNCLALINQTVVKKKVTDWSYSGGGETNCAKWNFAMVRFYW